jgi:hypothetical protein
MLILVQITKEKEKELGISDRRTLSRFDEKDNKLLIV